jgi:hypothetical protein
VIQAKVVSQLVGKDIAAKRVDPHIARTRLAAKVSDPCSATIERRRERKNVVLPRPNVNLTVGKEDALHILRNVKAAHRRRKSDGEHVSLAVTVVVTNKVDGSARNPVVVAVHAVGSVEEQIRQLRGRSGLSVRRSGVNHANEDDGALGSRTKARLMQRAQSGGGSDGINQHRVGLGTISSNHLVRTASNRRNDVGLKEQVEFSRLILEPIRFLRRGARINRQNVHTTILRKRNALYKKKFEFFEKKNAWNQSKRLEHHLMNTIKRRKPKMNKSVLKKKKKKKNRPEAKN